MARKTPASKPCVALPCPNRTSCNECEHVCFSPTDRFRRQACNATSTAHLDGYFATAHFATNGASELVIIGKIASAAILSGANLCVSACLCDFQLRPPHISQSQTNAGHPPSFLDMNFQKAAPSHRSQTPEVVLVALLHLLAWQSEKICWSEHAHRLPELDTYL